MSDRMGYRPWLRSIGRVNDRDPRIFVVRIVGEAGCVDNVELHIEPLFLELWADMGKGNHAGYGPLTNMLDEIVF